MKQLAFKHWIKIISQWPKDKLRPQEVTFQTLMRKRLDKYENPAKAAESAKVKGNAANVQPIDLTWNEAKEARQVNALYSLMDDKFARKYKLPQNLRRPLSQPDHYDMVVEESEKAPSRGIFEKISIKLRNLIRAQ